MEAIAEILLSIIGSVFASTGLWRFLEVRANKKDARNAMLRGLAHDRIMSLGMKYIERGYITPDEYENLNDYLYVPYCGLHGNGSAAKIMDEVKRLPIVSGRPTNH